jgi:predicted nuclease of predicted toxin-antitoxin system
MKLLLEENLSRQIIPALLPDYSESTQVALLELNEAHDFEVWEFAKNEGFAIVTQDADSHEQSVLTKGPPLIIWLRCGNQPRSVILKKLLNHKIQIKEAALDDNIWCLEIY